MLQSFEERTGIKSYKEINIRKHIRDLDDLGTMKRYLLNNKVIPKEQKEKLIEQANKRLSALGEARRKLNEKQLKAREEMFKNYEKLEQQRAENHKKYQREKRYEFLDEVEKRFGG